MKWLLLVFGAYLLTACETKSKIQKNILPPAEMGAVLWDMISADEFVSGYILLKDPELNRKVESISLYDQIYTIHHTNKETFRNSLSYYQAHPDLLINILDSISAKQTALSVRPVRHKYYDSVKVIDKSPQ